MSSVVYDRDRNIYKLQHDNGTTIEVIPEALGKARYQNAFKTQNPTTKPNMLRLTTSGDWTILSENGKLVAIGPNGQTIRATGSLLSCDGKAWLLMCGKLWSGELQRHETEGDIQRKKEKEHQAKISAIYTKMYEEENKLKDKYTEMINKLNENF